CFSAPDVEIATLVKPFKSTDGLEKLMNPLSPQVVLNKKYEATYFSRAVIPFLRDVQQDNWLSKHQFYKHIGIYGYRTDIPAQLTQLGRSELEDGGAFEPLRGSGHGVRIQGAVTKHETLPIHTPADMQKA